jgi:hypothetical protein
VRRFGKSWTVTKDINTRLAAARSSTEKRLLSYVPGFVRRFTFWEGRFPGEAERRKISIFSHSAKPESHGYSFGSADTRLTPKAEFKKVDREIGGVCFANQDKDYGYSLRNSDKRRERGRK